MSEPLRYVVSGGRYYRNKAHVWSVLDSEPIGVIIQGECPYGGADKLAAEWAEYHCIPCIGMRAYFKRMGPRAGPVRNGWMFDICGPIYKLIAFPGGRGTANAVEQAIKREILVRDEREAKMEKERA